MCPTYNQLIPQPTDKISVSQDQLLQNFQQLNTAFSVNHEAYNSAKQGLHTVVNMPTHIVGYNPTVNASEVCLFSRVDTTTTTDELFVKRGNGGAIYNCTGASLGQTGWSWLPSGLMIQWGRIQAFTDAPVAVLTFPRAFPNQLFSITGTILNATASPTAASSVSFNALAAATCNVVIVANIAYPNPVGQTVCWIATGY